MSMTLQQASKVKWRTSLPVYRCPPDCGLCCQQLLVECSATDVIREPRIQEVAPMRMTDQSKTVIDKCWILAGAHDCAFLQDRRCSIYSTRPNTCVNFPAGGEKCRELRERAGLPPLVAQPADGSMNDRLAAELTEYADESDDDY